jgi:uncharacterized protein (TIGR00255 family)
MPYSMTGFASADSAVSPFRLSWEIRSVNHRFLDLSFRLPDELRRLEPKFREGISQQIKRGKLDCALKIRMDDEAASAYDVDMAALIGLGVLEERIRETLPDAAPLSVADIVRWTGVLREPSQNFELLEAPAFETLDRALAQLQAARQSEGQRIAGFLGERISGISGVLDQIRPMLDSAQDRYREKFLERIAKLDIDVNPERLEQEMALVAQRLDISEEFDRLVSHIEEINDVLTRDEPIGRRFLIQELNREANTLSSKSPDETLTRASVDMKVLIEQMREQVQNLE